MIGFERCILVVAADVPQVAFVHHFVDERIDSIVCEFAQIRYPPLPALARLLRTLGSKRSSG